MTRLDWKLVAVAALALPLAACGDDDAADDDSSTVDAAAADAPVDAAPTPDAPAPDAGPLDTTACPKTYGVAAVSSTFGVAEETVGFDLDGDDTVDNSIGASQAIRTILSNEFEASIANGTLLSLSELRDFDGFGADDADLSIVIYGGTDTDDNLDDNFLGDESFTYQHSWVNSVTCEPVAAAAAQIVGGELTSSGATIRFFVDTLGGFLEIVNTHVSATLEPDTAGMKTAAGTKALVAGVITGCSLAQPAVLDLGNSAQHALTIVGVQPDIDRDGDGLEQIVGNIVEIEKCIDGDGTEIPGMLCGCDPRMQDGYSVTFETDLVGAVIVGPDP